MGWLSAACPCVCTAARHPQDSPSASIGWEAKSSATCATLRVGCCDSGAALLTCGALLGMITGEQHKRSVGQHAFMSEGQARSASRCSIRPGFKGKTVIPIIKRVVSAHLDMSGFGLHTLRSGAPADQHAGQLDERGLVCIAQADEHAPSGGLQGRTGAWCRCVESFESSSRSCLRALLLCL